MRENRWCRFDRVMRSDDVDDGDDNYYEDEFKMKNSEIDKRNGE